MAPHIHTVLPHSLICCCVLHFAPQLDGKLLRTVPLCSFFRCPTGCLAQFGGWWWAHYCVRELHHFKLLVKFTSDFIWYLFFYLVKPFFLRTETPLKLIYPALPPSTPFLIASPNLIIGKPCSKAILFPNEIIYHLWDQDSCALSEARFSLFLIIITTGYVCLQREILEKLGPERERERSGLLESGVSYTAINYESQTRGNPWLSTEGLHQSFCLVHVWK